MRLSLIVAFDQNMVIGYEGKMPWHLPNDFAHFKSVTMGKSIIMGRRTFDSIGRPLPGRANIVISRQAGLVIEGAEVVNCLSEALNRAKSKGGQEAFIIGGGLIYEEALPLCDRIYATEIDAAFEGDVWFPKIDPGAWVLLEEKSAPADDRNQHSHTFKIYERRP